MDKLTTFHTVLAFKNKCFISFYFEISKSTACLLFSRPDVLINLSPNVSLQEGTKTSLLFHLVIFRRFTGCYTK